MSERKPNFKSILKNSADTMIKFVQKYNMQNNQQKELMHLFQHLDSNKNKINGKNKKLSYGIVDLKQLCNQSDDFVDILKKMLDDKQKFYQMVKESQHITYTHKDVYSNELKDYYLKELNKTKGKFFKIAGEENKTKLKKLYHDRIKAEQQQSQNQNLRDSQIDQNNDALEQYTALRNSTTSVESLFIGVDQFASSDQEQGRQNNQASYHNKEWYQEEDQIDFQNQNNDFINDALEQYTALRNSTTSVESLFIGYDQFASSDQEQGRQNNQASYHNKEWYQEEDQIDFQNQNNDFINPYQY